MKMEEFSDLIMQVLEQPAPAAVKTLSAEIAAAAPLGETTRGQLDLLWEKWSAELPDTACAELVVRAAESMSQDVADPRFRKLLVDALKTLLPREFGHNPVMRALGVRDDKLPLPDVAARFRRLRELKCGVVLYLPGSARWGALGSVDPINAVVAINAFRGVGANMSLPLDSVISDAVILAADLDLLKLMEPSVPQLPSQKFREIVARRAKLPVSEAQMRAMALSGCAKKMTEAAFNAYWSNTSAAGAAAGSRRACDGRSMLEVDHLLDNEAAAGAPKFTDEEVACLRGFFERLKADTISRDPKQLASLIAKLVDRASAQQLGEMLKPLLGKTPFWPGDPLHTPLPRLEVWGELPAKLVEQLAKATCCVFSEEYLASCMARLPLKALNALGLLISDETLTKCVGGQSGTSADLLLWIWKNRKKRNNAALLGMINADVVVRVLCNSELPKAWGPAYRELRTMLMDDEALQKQLLAAADGNARGFTSALQGALFFSTSERQSLLVKLSRHSKMLQDYLENGAAQQILTAGIGAAKEVPEAPKGDEPNYTSVKSHRRMIKELDDIVNIHIPENREALKTARAHGDFRENSEFDAAKERRNHLSRRRSELERDLALIQPVIMRQVAVTDTAVIGCQIDLEYDNGERETCCLLGAWDGDPERKFLAYRTRLGAAILNHKVGDEFAVPGDRRCKLLAVRPLPEEIIAELDC